MTELTTNAEQAITLLKPLCGEHKKVAKPFGCVRNEVRYIGATDGKLLVLIRSEIELPELPLSLGSVFAHYKQGKPVNFAALKAFAGKAQEVAPCPKCNGHGGRTHCCEDCSQWEGAREVYQQLRPGKVGPLWFNLNLLARAFEVIPAVKVIELSIAEHYGRTIDETPPLFAVAPDWWVILMPISPGSESNDIPTFNVSEF